MPWQKIFITPSPEAGSKVKYLKIAITKLVVNILQNFRMQTEVQ